MRIRILSCFFILHSAFCLSSRAQGTAFTYQGRQNELGAPVTYYQFIVTAHSATVTGCKVRFFNAGNATAALNGNLQLLIIGSR